MFVKQVEKLKEDDELSSPFRKDNECVTPEGFFETDKMLENNLNEHLEVKINTRKKEMNQLKNSFRSNTRHPTFRKTFQEKPIFYKQNAFYENR